jgi:pyruvate ferredoxin oxidoreductase alpha subunit/phenylglyoxylate dehydrogenase alpha subunit
MFEPYLRTPGLRLPIVMSIVTRDTLTPQGVWGGHQDAMSVREVGWIQMYCESVQEVLDTVIIAYRVAEDRDVMLPVSVCHDGNYLSFGTVRVELPAQETVDAFLGTPDVNWHAALDPDRPMAIDPLTGGAGGVGPSLFVGYRKGQVAGMQRSLEVICTAHEEWGRLTGRQHAPLIECYRMDGADFAIVTIGSMTGAAKDAIDEARDAGRRAGLVKVKTFRPFPAAQVAAALGGVRAIGVVDRSVDFAWNCGPLYREVVTSLAGLTPCPASRSFIGGLAGADLTLEHFARVIDETGRLPDAVPAPGPVWLNAED